MQTEFTLELVSLKSIVEKRKKELGKQTNIEKGTWDLTIYPLQPII